MALNRRHALGALVVLAAVTLGRLESRHARHAATDPVASERTPRTRSAESAPRPVDRSGASATLIAPAHVVDPAPPEPDHPHPITPEHERIFRENRLIGAMNGAMDVGDATGLRRLLAEYVEEYPEDDQELSAGYAVIADCLDAPGAASRAAAEQWSQQHRGSTLRRFVIRHCFSE